MKFRYLTIEDGLPSNRVSCIFRDSKDYLWIGTDIGLCRYDGEKIKTFVSSTEDSTSLSNGNVYCIFEDTKGKLWIGTAFGLNLFDPETESFKRYLSDSTKQNSLSGNYISNIIQDKNGSMWISTNHGFNKYNPETNDFKRYYLPDNNKQKNNNAISNIGYDSDNTLWFGTFDDVLWSFKISEAEFEKHVNPVITPNLNEAKRVAILGNNVWIGCMGSGLFVYNIPKREFKKIPVAIDGKGTSGKYINSIAIDKGKYLLIGIDQGGLNRLDPQTMKMEYCMKDSQNEKSLNNNGVWNFYVDKEDIVYIGTSAGGVNIYNPKEALFTKYEHQAFNDRSLAYNIVYCFFEDSQGLIWIGTDGGGVSVFNPKTKTFRNYISNPNDPTTISGNAVLCIGEDKNHDIWLGTWGYGLNKFNRKTGKFTHYLPKENDLSAISGNNVWRLVFDDKDQMWLSYLTDYGVDLFDINKGVVRRFRNDLHKPESISNNVTGICRLGHDLGFLTYQGFYTWQPESASFKKWDLANYTYLNDVYRDSKGNLWFCTDVRGLFKMSPSGSIEKFGENCGLPNYINKVIEDNNGDIWIGSQVGLSRYDVSKNEFTHNYLSYSNNDKIFATISMLKASNGTLYIGGYSGFFTFNPQKVATNNYIPRVVFNEFQLFNKPVTTKTPGSPLKKSIDQTSEIVLKYDEAVFTFGFTALNYTNPQKARYAYKLEGYDKDWIYTNSERKNASYTKPDPGNYTFMVKATNNDGLWNEVPRTIKVTIVPPFWKSWWFRSSLAILLFGSFLSFYFWRMNNFISQQRILEKAVWTRTAELRMVNDELALSKEEVMNKNLAIQNQNLELEIANQTKDKLFSIIAHDLKSPFNSILGFVNILNNDFDVMSEVEKRQFLAFIQKSSQTAFNLIESLLDWARTQTDQITLKIQHINVAEMIGENVELVKISGETKSISIWFDNVDKTHYISADRNMIDTVIRNLLTNAIKFSKKDSMVLISSTKVSDYICISIKDQGVGMNNDQIEKLFYIDENHSTKGTLGELGTGLGLIICKEFIERNNGKIVVTSVVGEGTTIEIWLPTSS